LRIHPDVGKILALTLGKEAGMDMELLVNRMLRAAKLEPAVYEEVEADEGALEQALAVVLISSLAAGLGRLPAAGLGGLIVGVIGALLGWVVWAGIVYIIGTNLLPGQKTQTDMPEMLRTLGFASAPGVIRVLGIIPGLGLLTALIASVWSLVAMVIAVRQALDYDTTGRAILVCVIGWVASLIVFGIVGALFGGSLLATA
jgi:hypothetical protein